MGAKGGGLIGDAPTIVVTPKSKPPNVIPFNEAPVHHLNQQRKKHIVHPLEERIDVGGDDNEGAQTAIRTPQQILREKIFGGSKQGLITTQRSYYPLGCCQDTPSSRSSLQLQTKIWT